MTRPRIRGALTYEGHQWTIIDFRPEPAPPAPKRPRSTPASPIDPASPPPPRLPAAMVEPREPPSFVVEEDGRVVHQASGEPQQGTAHWVIGRSVRPEVATHSWSPSAGDFVHARVIALENGVVVDSWSWEEEQARWAQRLKRSVVLSFAGLLLCCSGLAVLLWG